MPSPPPSAPLRLAEIRRRRRLAARRRRLIIGLKRTTGTMGLTAVVLVVAFLALGPRTGRYQVVTVLSGSMSPTLAKGSLAVVAPKPAGEVKVGDVLSYTIPVDDHRVVTHRVVEVRTLDPAGTARPTVRTKGDANGANDPWLATIEGAEVWTVRASIAHGGTLVRHLREPLTGARLPRALAALFAVASLARVWLPRDRRRARVILHGSAA